MQVEYFNSGIKSNCRPSSVTSFMDRERRGGNSPQEDDATDLQATRRPFSMTRSP